MVMREICRATSGVLMILLCMGLVSCGTTSASATTDTTTETETSEESSEESSEAEELSDSNEGVFADANVALSKQGHFQHLIAVFDANGDGNDDLLVGGDASGTTAATPILLLVSDGEGGLSDQTSTYLQSTPSVHSPKGGTADVNGDGTVDIILYDSGDSEAGQHSSEDFGGGFDGGEPYLLLSQEDGTWAVSDLLAQAAAAANNSCVAFCEADKEDLHIKSFSTGDVDGDGRIDLFIESGGGYRQLYGHLLHQTSALNFTVRSGSPWYDDDIRVGTASWRWASSLLADMDGDGDLDLVLGRLARIDNDQDAMRNSVVFNNGSGHFLDENRVELAQPSNWNDNWTYVKGIAATDLNGDGDLDLVLAHERSNDASKSDEDNTGRYLQFFINNGDQTFTDETSTRLSGDTASLSATHTSDENGNFNMPEKMFFQDIDDDGDQDLVMQQYWASISSSAPIFYINNGSGVFTPESTTEFSEFQSRPITADLNGDGKTDVIVPSISSNGDDETFGTTDDTTSFTVYLRQ